MKRMQCLLIFVALLAALPFSNEAMARGRVVIGGAFGVPYAYPYYSPYYAYPPPPVYYAPPPPYAYRPYAYYPAPAYYPYPVVGGFRVHIR